MIGSIISAIIGYGYLRIVGAKRKNVIWVYHNANLSNKGMYMIKRILILCTVLCMTNMMAFAQATSVDKGQRGHHVQKIQTMLVHQGYLNDSADGIFGRNTELAVRKFQKAKGLAVDGRVGAATMSGFRKGRNSFWRFRHFA